MYHDFLHGMMVMGSLIAGLFFLRFWRKTRDRLFFIFAIAFWILAVNWMVIAHTNEEEPRSGIYLIRLGAFLLILLGIVDKNRARSKSNP